MFVYYTKGVQLGNDFNVNLLIFCLKEFIAWTYKGEIAWFIKYSAMKH